MVNGILVVLIVMGHKTGPPGIETLHMRLNHIKTRTRKFHLWGLEPKGAQN